ncbi:MAG TPA: serine hydrolase domain-containing protein [Streptosporangiaceae bacterium]|nr:serine hydrolase domain-containing protein [Streptosporangiaceae bacterium]
MIEDRTRRLLDVRLAHAQADQRLPSVVAGLARDGELIWTGSCGLVDGRAPDAGTQYRAGSITKTFTAVVVLRMRDAGELALSDQIGEHLDLAAAGASGEVAAMTVGQLLSHSAGLRAETAGPWWERTPGSGLGDLATSSLGSEAARFRPGQRHHYSNVGYGLLGAMIASKAGRPWYEVISAELLTPLHMTRTTLRPQGPAAVGYAVHPYADVLLAEPEHDAKAMAPAGQLWTTITDLARFARFLTGDGKEIISSRTLAEMREPAVLWPSTGQPWSAAYGFGLQLWNDAGTSYYGHTGSMPGFQAVLRVTDAPGADTVLAACNSTAGFGHSLATDLLEILATQEPYLPAEWRPAEVEPGLLEVLGAWYWGPAPYTLSLSGDELELSMTGADGPGMRFGRDGSGSWRGLDGYMAGEPLSIIAGSDGRPLALNIGSFIYSRTPYDPAAPIPGGVPKESWHAAPRA